MTEPAYLATVRQSYDRVAQAYLAQVPPASGMDPLLRSMLAAFAELVRTTYLGPVADLGCGPGLLTAHLAGLGVPAFGIDLSPKMIDLARQAHPELRCRVGTMTALDLPTRAWAASWPSSPADHLAALLADAGLTVTARLLMTPPDEPAARRQEACLLARKPDQPV